MQIDQAQGYKTAFMLNTTEHDSSSAHKKLEKDFFLLSNSQIF